MKWAEILRKTFGYIKKYRALWYLGILAALAEGGGGVGNYYNSSSSFSNTSNTMQSSMNKLADWVSGNRAEFTVIVLAIFIISLILLFVSYSAKAGLIYSIGKAESEDEKPEFHSAFHTGQNYFWRFVGLTLLVALMIFAIVFVLAGLVATLIILVASVSLWFLIIVIPVGLLLILGIIVMAAYLSWILQFGYREIVIKNKKIIAAFSAARELVHHHFANVILAWLIQAALSLAAGIGLALIALIVGGVLFAIGVGIYFAGGFAAVIAFGAPAALAYIALILLISGIINAYFSTYWTLIYNKLANQ